MPATTIPATTIPPNTSPTTIRSAWQDRWNLVKMLILGIFLGPIALLALAASLADSSESLSEIEANLEPFPDFKQRRSPKRRFVGSCDSNTSPSPDVANATYVHDGTEPGSNFSISSGIRG